MGKLTFILGTQRSGKTTKARELAGTGGVVADTHRVQRGIIDGDIKEAVLNGETIILDEVTKINTYLYDFLKLKQLNLRKPFTERSKPFDMPDIIVCSNTLTEADTTDFPRATVIVMPSL